MDSSSKRGDPRVACRIPIRLLSTRGWISGYILDVSRRGARLAIPIPELGLDPTTSMLTVARRLPDLLPREAPVEFDPERFGPLIARRIQIVRIASAGRQEGEIEVGCLIEGPMADQEADILGIELPAGEERAVRKGVVPRTQVAPDAEPETEADPTTDSVDASLSNAP
ncbi:MAG: PilZ domain-containing protein [Planctomycetota bacterium]|jgi:hypothetical protein